MTNSERIRQYLFEVQGVLQQLPVDGIARVVDLLASARVQGKKVLLLGNGGSASTASHFASDLSKGATCAGKPRIRASALTDNLALLTAWANDTDYANIFSEQLDTTVDPGDVVICISGSGNSANVLKAAMVARARGAVTVGFTGFTGGKLKDLVDIAIVVPCHQMEQVEDVHLLLEHMITVCLREGPG